MDGLIGSSALTDLPLSPASSAYIGPHRARMTGAVTLSGITLDRWCQSGHRVGVPLILTYASRWSLAL